SPRAKNPELLQAFPAFPADSTAFPDAIIPHDRDPRSAAVPVRRGSTSRLSALADPVSFPRADPLGRRAGVRSGPGPSLAASAGPAREPRGTARDGARSPARRRARGASDPRTDLAGRSSLRRGLFLPGEASGDVDRRSDRDAGSPPLHRPRGGTAA